MSSFLDPACPTVEEGVDLQPPVTSDETSAARVPEQEDREEGGATSDGGRGECLNSRQQSATNFGAPARVAIFHHPACEAHHIENHPEQPSRVSAILSRLQRDWPQKAFRQVSAKATDEQLLLFHTKSHVNQFNAKCSRIESRGGIDAYDGDTQVMRHTREAAYYAAGSIIEAIDLMFLPDDHKRRIDTAFCCVRPPGHHAERNRAMGFCFLSNASIGARYAQHKHGVKKVAVVDFDVHHGNGTEEGFTHDETLFYGSTHEYEAYPGTGKDHYPHIGDNAKNPLHRRIVNRVLYAEHSSSNRGVAARKQFREKWRHVIDEMILFAPDLVIMSAGFDAHDDDPLANCDLTEDDFEWATDIVIEACALINPDDPVKYCSILEGGYDLEALGESAAAHVRALAKGYPPPPETGGDEVKALAKYMESIGL